MQQVLEYVFDGFETHPHYPPKSSWSRLFALVPAMGQRARVIHPWVRISCRRCADAKCTDSLMSHCPNPPMLLLLWNEAIHKRHPNSHFKDTEFRKAHTIDIIMSMTCCLCDTNQVFSQMQQIQFKLTYETHEIQLHEYHPSVKTNQLHVSNVLGKYKSFVQKQWFDGFLLGLHPQSQSPIVALRHHVHVLMIILTDFMTATDISDNLYNRAE